MYTVFFNQPEFDPFVFYSAYVPDHSKPLTLAMGGPPWRGTDIQPSMKFRPFLPGSWRVSIFLVGRPAGVAASGALGAEGGSAWDVAGKFMHFLGM